MARPSPDFSSSLNSWASINCGACPTSSVQLPGDRSHPQALEQKSTPAEVEHRDTLLLETECVQVFSARDQNVLMPVQHVSDGGVAGIRQETGVPERITVSRVEGDEVSGTV